MPEGLDARPEPPKEAEREKTPFEVFEAARKSALQDLILRWREQQKEFGKVNPGCEGKEGFSAHNCCETHRRLQRESVVLQTQAFELAPRITQQNVLDEVIGSEAFYKKKLAGGLDNPSFASQTWFSEVKKQFGVE